MMTEHGLLGTPSRSSWLLSLVVFVLTGIGGIIAVTWQSARQFDAIQYEQSETQRALADGQARISQETEGLGALASHVRSIDDQLSAITASRTDQATKEALAHDAVLQLQGQVTALQTEIISLQDHVTSAEVVVTSLSKDLGDIRCKLWPSQCGTPIHPINH